jgi:AcrR family transcriptional regulator
MSVNSLTMRAMKSRREGHTEQTVAALIRAGRARFGKHGFEAVNIADIAADARVTTGAVYHHFEGKKGLFLAVAEQIEGELLTQATASAAPDPWQRILEGFDALVDACATPPVQQIIFLDAPRVIGTQEWREVELKYAYGAMSQVFERLVREGIVRPYPTELLTQVLLAVLAQASRAVALAPAMRANALDLMRRVLGSLRTA